MTYFNFIIELLIQYKTLTLTLEEAMKAQRDYDIF